MNTRLDMSSTCDAFYSKIFVANEIQTERSDFCQSILSRISFHREFFNKSLQHLTARGSQHDRWHNRGSPWHVPLSNMPEVRLQALGIDFFLSMTTRTKRKPPGSWGTVFLAARSNLIGRIGRTSNVSSPCHLQMTSAYCIFITSWSSCSNSQEERRKGFWNGKRRKVLEREGWSTSKHPRSIRDLCKEFA